MHSKNPEDLKKDVAQLREWMLQQNLPKDIDDIILGRFVHSCYYDMEKAKTACALFFNLRTSSPELMNNRDPLSSTMQRAIKITNLAQLDISGNRSLWIWQLNDPSLDNYDYTVDGRLFILALDAYLLSANEELKDEDVIILDVKNMSLKVVTKLNLSVARKLTKYQQEAIPIRLRQIHVVNCPSVIDKLYLLLKPMLRNEITDAINFHTPNSETLYKFVSKDDLPKDYGGTLQSMDEYMKTTLKQIMVHRETLIREDFWKTETKGKKEEFSSNVGTFKTLDID